MGEASVTVYSSSTGELRTYVHTYVHTYAMDRGVIVCI
jgi:hypothetical protein